MKALLRRCLPVGLRARLRGIRKFCRYRWRRLRIMLPVARRQPMRVILGAAETWQPGWYSTNECWLDITDAAHWQRVFRGRRLITHAVAEHVFEHLARDEALRALRLLAAHMVAGGRVRIAVPDGYHPDPEYRRQVGVGGVGDDAADHKQLLDVDTLSALLAEAGFAATQIEGYDRTGNLVLRPWQAAHGLIRRSRQNPDASAGWGFPDAGTSLIVDGTIRHERHEHRGAARNLRKIILVTISLDRMAGGLERNIVRIANHFATQGDAVHLASFDEAHATAFFPLDPRVRWERIGTTRPHARVSFLERLALIGRLRTVIRAEAGESVVVVAFHHGILLRLWLAGLFRGARLICSERNSLSLYDHITLGKWNANFLMLHLTEKIVVQLEAYRRDYPRALQRRIVAIPNAVEPARMRAAPAVPDPHGRFRLLAVGRLCDQKNYGCLIRAFASLVERFPAWDLAIAGDGPLLAELHGLVHELRLETRVSLPGAIADLAPWYASAHLYCMPSKWEGFPNALAEAMAAGLPAVGFADCAGVRDLIAHGENGLLAAGSGEAASLAAQLELPMADPSLRRAMGERAEQAMRRYRPENVYPRWDALLGERA